MEKKYTEAQNKAVHWDEGPVVVLAGPGSGKTAVLTERIKRILSESKEESFRILALTFTNKAAQEMSERIQAGVQSVEHRLFVGTFHSFCSEILRTHGSYIGLKTDFDIYSSDDDLNEVINEIASDYKDINPLFPSEDLKLLNMIKYFERKLCYTEEEVLAAMPKTEYSEAFKWIYMEYLKRMIAKSILDYDMLILLSHRVFIMKPPIARMYARTYKYINIDEFQDTNYGQYKLIMSMCGQSNNNIFIVADDDQVIYGWNGADHKRITEFKNSFNAELIQLNQNFRCPMEVIGMANRLIAHNSGRTVGKKPLEAMKTEVGEHVFFNKFENEREETVFISELLKRLIEENEGESIGVLARNNRLLELAYQEALANNIPCEKSKRKADFETPYILWMFLILKLANHRTDKKIMKQMISVLNECLGTKIDEDAIILESDMVDGDLLKAVRTLTHGLYGDPEFEKSLSLNLVEGRNFIQFIKDAFEWSEEKINQINDESYRVQMLEDFNIEKKVWIDFERNLSYNYDLKEMIISTYIQEFSMVSKEEEPRPGAVQFLTIHASKGKEFDHVILMGLVNDELPSFQSVKKGINSPEMEEERRNCFVAITRAKKKLYMTCANSYFGWRKNQSLFVSEMFGN